MNSRYALDGRLIKEAIEETKHFIETLTVQQKKLFTELVWNLQLSEEGSKRLFDYMYNIPNSKKHVSFEEYLSEHNLVFEDLVMPISDVNV